MASPGSFWAPINAKLEQRHQDALDLQKQQRASYQGIIQDPNTSDEVKNWAWGEYQKSLHPEVRKRFGQLQPIVDKIFGGMQQKQPQSVPPPSGGGPVPAPTGPTPLGQIPAPSGGPSPIPSGTGPGAPATAATPQAGPPVFDTAAANKRALDFAKQKSDIEEARQVAVAKAKPQLGTIGKTQQYKLPDGSVMSVQQHSRSGQFYDLQGNPTVLPEAAEPYKAPTPGTRKQFRYTVNDPDGKQREVTVFQDTKSQQMFDVHGKPYELPANAEPVDEEAKLAKIRGSYYGTGEMNNLKRAFKSEYPDIGDDEAERMAGAVAIERAKREMEMKGAPRTVERPMVVGGEVKAVPFTNAPVLRPYDMPSPQGGGVPAPAPTPAAAPGSAPRGPVPAPAPGGSPAGAAPRPAPAAAGGGVPVAAPGRTVGVPVAQYRAMLNDIRSVRAGAGQLFGDPNVPGVKGLVEYGDLADNKDSRDRLGRAFRLTFDGLDQASSGGSAGVHGEGGRLDIGGIGTWVGNQLGMPAAVAGQQAKMMQEAVGALTPREREAYNATIASAEGIIGLRRITGASPSVQSVRAIQEAMPIIGVNTVDSKQFADKGRRLAVEFSAGTRGIPKAGFDSETQKQVDEINRLPSRMLGSGGAPAKPPRPTINSQKEFDALPKGAEYIDKADGKPYKKP